MGVMEGAELKEEGTSVDLLDLVGVAVMDWKSQKRTSDVTRTYEIRFVLKILRP